MIKYLNITTILLFSISLCFCQQSSIKNSVKFGNEIFIQKHLAKVKNKRVGIVTNQTGVLPNGTYLIDTLVSVGIDITAIFGLEHGFRGNLPAGENIDHLIDEKTGIPVYSLYGWEKKPTQEMLNQVDVILFDVQDIGARFYTYISSLYYILQSAAENNISVIVLDRPNPCGGNYIDGPVLDMNFSSFVGVAPLPVTHGLTIGETAQLFVGENYISVDNKSILDVIKCDGWQRNLFWDDIRENWIPTSPNIQSFETALVYPGTCFLEGTNISEGRGTDDPFLTIGAPFINADDLINTLRSLDIKGVNISAIEFVPDDMPGKSSNTKYKGIECRGIKIKVWDKKEFRSVEFGINLIHALLKLCPDNFKFKADYFDLLAGNDKLRKDLLAGVDPATIIGGWQTEIETFKSLRKKYLLY